jgi:hypothetical protein
MQVFCKCEGAAVLTGSVKHADGVEAGDAACQSKRVAACEGFQSVGGAGGVRQCGDARCKYLRAWVGKPVAATTHKGLQVLATPGAVKHLCEGHGGVHRVRCSFGDQTAQAVNGSIAPAKSVVNDGAQQGNVVRRRVQAHGAFDGLICHGEAPQGEGCPRLGVPRPEVSGVSAQADLGSLEHFPEGPACQQRI